MRTVVAMLAASLCVGLAAAGVVIATGNDPRWTAGAELEMLDPELEQRIARDYGGERPSAGAVDAGMISDLTPVAQRAASRLGDADPDELVATTRVVADSEAGRVLVTVEGSDPNQAAARANAMSLAYAARKEQLERSDRRKALELVAREIERERGADGDPEALEFAKRRRAYVQRRLRDGATEPASLASAGSARPQGEAAISPPAAGLIAALATGSVLGLWLLLRSRLPLAPLERFLGIELRRLRDFDVLVLAAFLIALATFGKQFAELGPESPPIRPTEIVLVLVAALMLVRLGPRRAWRVARERVPLLWLGLFWVAGTIATLRGLKGFGLGEVEHDVGTFAYSLLVPLVVLVADSAARRRVLVLALAAGGLGGALFFLIANVGVRSFHYSAPLVEPGSGLGVWGLYMALALAYFAALACFSRRSWRLALALAAPLLLLVVLTDKRGMWLAALVAIGVAVAAAPSAVRLRAAGAAIAGVVAIGLLALGIERLIDESPDPAAVQRSLEPSRAELPSLANHAGPALPLGQADSAGPQISKELFGFGDESDEAQNVRWRVAYWRELLGRVPEQPLLGVGFGEPTRFVFAERTYDFRNEDPDSTQAYTGPHNAFVEVVYRMGLVGLAGLLGTLAAALVRAVRSFSRAPGRSYERFEIAALLSMLGGSMVVFSFNDAISSPALSVFFFGLLGLLLARPGADRQGARPGT